MNLFEKIKQTVAGRHAVALGQARYDHGASLGEKYCTALAAAEAYLESIAIAELEASIEPWQGELAERKKKVGAP